MSLMKPKPMGELVEPPTSHPLHRLFDDVFYDIGVPGS